MKSLLDWLDQRTGFRGLVHAVLYENVPGGARWRYIWGRTLTFALAVQFATGIFLWTSYSPSAQTAWESVNFIQNEMFGGWLLRGLHHYNSQALVVLLILHLMQVVIDGAYRAPREVNFWFGLGLLQLIFALSLTGWLLPWDQRGYWASKVATNIMGVVPVIGHDLRKVVIGGADYGHQTLTRFFALHAGILPGTLIALLAGHVYLARRHGPTVKEPKRGPDAAFWPDQALKDAVACLAVMATMLFLVVRHKLFATPGYLGAELGAPADPSEPYSAARPEWYFLFLFQFLKYFPAGREVWGAVVIPSLILVVLVLMPFIARWKWGHRLNLGIFTALFTGAGLLTLLALREDRQNPVYQIAVTASERDAERVRELAHSPEGIPITGAVTLLRNDPLTQGPRIFAKHCAQCHRFDGHNGMGRMVREPQSAADLKGFGSRAWIAGLLDPAKISTTNYFGGSKLKDGKMSKFVKKDVAGYTAAQKEQLQKVIAAVSGEARLKAQSDGDARDAELIKQGAALLKSDLRCTDCHQFHGQAEDVVAPDLTGYASREWLVRFLANPAHPDFYGKKNDRMPAFGEKQILSATEIGLLADWLRGDWYDSGSKAAAGGSY